MALSAFADKARPPQPGELEGVLGGAAGAWRRLVAHVSDRHPPVEGQWSFSSARNGWSLRLRRKDRVILYLIPQEGAFLVGVVLGERAAEAAHECGLPAAVVALVDAAPRYAEGRGIRFAVTGQEGCVAAEALVALKMAP
jgi:hypothetical protein